MALPLPRGAKSKGNDNILNLPGNEDPLGNQNAREDRDDRAGRGAKTNAPTPAPLPPRGGAAAATGAAPARPQPGPVIRPAQVVVQGILNESQVNDVELYHQLQTTHSREITGFSSRAACPQCFIEDYKLNRDIVRNLYTRNDMYKQLNISLCGDDLQNDRFIKMYTLLLADAIYHKRKADIKARTRDREIPRLLYRGQKISNELALLYRQKKGKVIYLYSFTSTSKDEEVAKRFAGRTGWIFEFEGCSDFECCADMVDVSKYPDEKEVLLSANMGFRVLEVDERKRRIYLSAYDERYCRREWPEGKLCKQHSEER